MTYIGMLIDKNSLEYISVEPCNDVTLNGLHLMNMGVNMLGWAERIKDFKSWPGQKISKDLFCEVVE